MNSKGTDKNDVGYLEKLSTDAQALIADTKYYLGNVAYYDASYNGGSATLSGIKDTANEAYVHERESKSCSSLSDNACQGGYIWPDNSATWIYKIALMHPSDYGYSADSNYWVTKLGKGTFNGTASDTSWLQTTANHNSYEWLLSPGSYGANFVAYWDSSGYLSNYPAIYKYGVRPCLYLKSNAIISDGNGEETDPYFVELA